MPDFKPIVLPYLCKITQISQNYNLPKPLARSLTHISFLMSCYFFRFAQQISIKHWLSRVDTLGNPNMSCHLDKSFFNIISLSLLQKFPSWSKSMDVFVLVRIIIPLKVTVEVTPSLKLETCKTSFCL